ncbi:MAG: 3'-5' exonuclease [Candidatus Rokuibacteriota bacterium]
MMPLALLPVVATSALTAGIAAWWRYHCRPTPTRVPLGELDFVAIDIETTGLDPRRDDIVALAAIPFVGGAPRPDIGCVELVNPGRPIPVAAQRIHGIGDAEVRDASPAAQVLPRFLDICRSHPIVAHTAAFDLAFIDRAAHAAGLRALRGTVLDIGALAHGLFPSWWDLSLEGLARLLEVELIDRHTARGDALSAGLIFLRMTPLLRRHGVGTLARALKLQRRAALVPDGPGPTGGGLAGP